MNFKNQFGIVTGGANGIGKCICETFVNKGAHVAFIDKDNENGILLQRKYPDKLFYFNGDISEETALQSFAKFTTQKFDKIDFIINNACLTKKGILSGCEFEDFNYVLKVGITAPYMLTKLLLPFLRKGASIVNISSTRAFQSQADTESYSAAKGGITALTHALSISLSGKVRVNSISPGWIDKQELNSFTSNSHDHDVQDIMQHPAGRIGMPSDIANMVLFLCSENAGFITGENIVIDGGMSRLMIYHNDNGWIYDAKS